MPMNRLSRARQAVADWLHAHVFLTMLLIVTVVAAPGYARIEWVQASNNEARCATGNEFRQAVQQSLHEVDDYINALLAGFGATNQVDVSKLTDEQRERYAEVLVRITKARADFTKAINDRGLAPRRC